MRKRLFIISLPVFLSVGILFLYKWRHPKELKDEILFYNYSIICRLSKKANDGDNDLKRAMAYSLVNYFRELNIDFYINDYGENYLWKVEPEENGTMSYNLKEIKENQNIEIKDMLEIFSGDKKQTINWTSKAKKNGDRNINYYCCAFKDLKVQFIMRVHNDSIPDSIKHVLGE